MQAMPSLARIAAALHPLAMVPAGSAWNLDEIADLLPDAAPVPAAVLVGLVPRADGVRVLLTRRTRTLRHHAGQVSFPGGRIEPVDRKSTRLNSSHVKISYAVFCLKKKKTRGV